MELVLALVLENTKLRLIKTRSVASTHRDRDRTEFEERKK